jgi:putative membrane protein
MKQPKAESFFSASEQERIHRAVASAEQKTSGEIATMVVDQSDQYLEAEVLGGILVAGLTAMVVSVSAHYVSLWSHLPLDMTIWSYTPLVVLLYFPARLLFARVPRFKVPFVNKARLIRAVRERAVRAFFEKGLYRTRDENGILIFISLLEHKVWILGDRGVDRLISHETWQVLARELSEGIGKGSSCEALCEVIEKCGRILADNFPPKRDDTNELSDKMIM